VNAPRPAAHAAFAADLHAALGQRPHRISPKWFYDAAGSALFERICELPEYYPTRTELGLLARHAGEMAECIGPDADLVEYGAGATRKVRLLLDALTRPARYLPIDISAEHLAQSAARLHADHPQLAVQAIGADFTQPFTLPAPVGRRVGFYPGGSIGNFAPEAALALLQGWARALAGGGLLIGVDLVKDPAELHAAYNDAQGVTAAFNRNLLVRARRELGADIDPEAFAHSAFYNPPQQRIEMHLVSRRAQRLWLDDVAYAFDEGESLHTEDSYKHTVEGFRRLARAAGFEPGAVWVDERRAFSVHWLSC
jgi:dimethylhistidine N-methyltransferase